MDEIDDPVVRWLFKHLNEESLNKRMEKFFKRHCFEFHDGCDWTEADESQFLMADEGEQSLENYDLYKRYTGIIEAALQDFCETEGLSQSEVFKTCQAASRESPMTEALLQMLLSASEYQLFALQMHLTWMAEKNSEGDDDEAEGKTSSARGESESKKQHK